MLESAAAQLEACRTRAGRSMDDSDAASVLERSECIYGQAVDIYNQTLRKVWVFLPAMLMDFRIVP